MTVSFFHSPMFPTYPLLNKTRLSYLTLCTVAGLYSSLNHTSGWPDIIQWGTIGLAIGCVALWVERQLMACSQSTLVGGSLGLIVGMAGTGLLILGRGLGFPQIPSLTPWVMLPAFLLCPYIGMMVGIHISKTLSPFPSTELPKAFSPHIPLLPSPNTVHKLLDSSAIIDGRILPLCTTGFLEGPLVVPQCILRELHALADSQHLSKRTRGKRGLDILSQLQQLPNLEMRVIDDWEPAVQTVDHQLIAIAKKREAKILTNDWNLVKIASLQGVPSLNVNELTYQLRPLVLPGEIIRVFIHKEGQGHGQGVAHLDDGTMVIVDHGATLVGRAVEVVVTRFMQTHTGRMIFSSPHGDHSPFLLNPNPLLNN